MNNSLNNLIKSWGLELGFQAISITDPNVKAISQRFNAMIEKDYHAGMNYLTQNKELRENPSLLVENTKSIIVARMDYLPPNDGIAATLRDKNKAYIARYALGQDYHKLIRKRLKTLAQKIEAEVGAFTWRPFADSAPVFEKPLAEKAGIGWQGKNTLIINPKAGSYFFLGVLYTSLDLPFDAPAIDHCGTCTACLDICPTNAFPAPYQLDARLCISYWTIEHKGTIPEHIRNNMGNRVFGCDDCQLVCPWNKYAKAATETAFLPRQHLNDVTLLDLFSWDEKTYLEKTQSSAIRRIGFEGWQRNLAIGLGNSGNPAAMATLKQTYATTHSDVVREAADWAIKKLLYKSLLPR